MGGFSPDVVAAAEALDRSAAEAARIRGQLSSVDIFGNPRTQDTFGKATGAFNFVKGFLSNPIGSFVNLVTGIFGRKKKKKKLRKAEKLRKLAEANFRSEIAQDTADARTRAAKAGDQLTTQRAALSRETKDRTSQIDVIKSANLLNVDGGPNIGQLSLLFGLGFVIFLIFRSR